MENLEKLTYDYFIPFGIVFSFAIGSCIGSFLNVCIWRIPRGENLSHPGSHCPSCNYEIPPYFNIPILAWLVLKGKCKNCQVAISPRYIIIEAFTGVLFVLITYHASLMRFPVESLLSLYFLAAAFITIIFIDIKHLIIPSLITWSGTGTALVFSVALPYTIILPANHAFSKLNIDQQWLLNKLPMLESSPRLLALCYSLLGFAMGFGILWSVVELGKALFGKQKFKYDEPIDIVLSAEGAQSAGDELLPWEEVFDRKTDELTIDVEEGSWQVGQDQGVFEKHTLTIKHDTITIGDTSYTLSDIKNIQLKSKFFVVPREAMGRGDIKMLAMIGAFLGPAGVVCSLMLATFSGCLVGGLGIFIGRFTKSKQLPFGPYLAIGAAIWMLFWPDLIEVYLQSIDSLGDLLGGSQ